MIECGLHQLVRCFTESVVREYGYEVHGSDEFIHDLDIVLSYTDKVNLFEARERPSILLSTGLDSSLLFIFHFDLVKRFCELFLDDSKFCL